MLIECDSMMYAPYSTLFSFFLFFGVFFFFYLFFATSYTLGMLTFTFHNPKNQAHYYNAKQLIQNSNKLHCKVSKVLKPSPYQYKYEVELKAVNAERKHGKLLLNLDKDSTQFILDVDDEFIWKSFRIRSRGLVRCLYWL